MAMKKTRPAAGSPWKLKGRRAKQRPTEAPVSASRMTQKSHSWLSNPRTFDGGTEPFNKDSERGLPACLDPGPFIGPHRTPYDRSGEHGSKKGNQSKKPFLWEHATWWTGYSSVSV